MKKCLSIFLILIYLLLITAQGDRDVPFFGFADRTWIDLRIESDCDAWIYFDGDNYSRKTPNNIKVLNPGNHTFMLQRDEMECCKKSIKIFGNYKIIEFKIDNCNLGNCGYEIRKG